MFVTYTYITIIIQWTPKFEYTVDMCNQSNQTCKQGSSMTRIYIMFPSSMFCTFRYVCVKNNFIPRYLLTAVLYKKYWPFEFWLKNNTHVKDSPNALVCSVCKSNTS